MNRRRPRPKFAVVRAEQGQDEVGVVLRRACEAALTCCTAQGGGAATAALQPFISGYLAGYARHQALKHGVDAEQGRDSDEPLRGLLAELASLPTGNLQQTLTVLRFSLRRPLGAAPRALLQAESPLADAGYLVGHLESLCGSQRLVANALKAGRGPEAAAAFVTACDGAADRMQTHQPTASLRFNAEERSIVANAFASV